LLAWYDLLKNKIITEKELREIMLEITSTKFRLRARS